MYGLSSGQFGISTLTWREQSPQWGIRRAGELGFACVDIGIIGGMATIDVPMLVDAPEQVLPPIEMALAETGVTVASFNARITAADEIDRRLQARALARAAQRLDVQAGVTLGHGGVDSELDAVLDDLRPVCEELHGVGVTPMVESHRGNFTQHVDQALALLEALPSLRFTLDASHYILQSLGPDDWAALLPYTAHCHLRSCRPGELIAAATDCSPLVGDWLAQLAAVGYRAAITYEIINDEASTLALRERLQQGVA